MSGTKIFDYTGDRNKAYRDRTRKAALELLGSVCVKCGFSDVRALQFDHINGGGNKEIKSNTKNYTLQIIKSIVNKEKKFQLLCANCNWIKRAENNEVRI